MSKASGNFVTVTVTGSNPVATPSGATALVLHTREAGSIAFQVDARAIAAIRSALVDCEALLTRGSGNA